jgi:hypothetical protein
VSVRVAYAKNPESEDLDADAPLGDAAFADNALMLQHGSTTLGAYPSMYTGVKPARASGEGRARRQRARTAARDADDGPSRGARVRGGDAPRRTAGSARGANAGASREMPDGVHGADDVPEDMPRVRRASRPQPPATPQAAGNPLASDTPDEPAVRPVRGSRSRAAGADFRREMAARVDGWSDVDADADARGGVAEAGHDVGHDAGYEAASAGGFRDAGEDTSDARWDGGNGQSR